MKKIQYSGCKKYYTFNKIVYYMLSAIVECRNNAETQKSL